MLVHSDGHHNSPTHPAPEPAWPISALTCLCDSCLQSLAYWLETSKMQSNLTGNLLGGTILGDLLQHVEDAVDAVSANVQVCSTCTSCYFERWVAQPESQDLDQGLTDDTPRHGVLTDSPRPSLYTATGPNKFNCHALEQLSSNSLFRATSACKPELWDPGAAADLL